MAKAIVIMTAEVSTAVEIDYQSTGDPCLDREQAIEMAAIKNRASLCNGCAQHMNPPGEWSPVDVELNA